MRGELRQPVIQRQQVWQQSGNDLVIPKHAADSESWMPGQWVSVDG